MKKTILLSAFVTAMAAFATTTGTVSASTAYSDVYTFEKGQHDLSQAKFDNMLTLNVKKMIDDYSSLELDGQVHYKGGITTVSDILDNFDTANAGFEGDKATYLSLKYTLPKTSYGMAYLKAGIYSKDKDNSSSRGVFEGDYSYKFDKVTLEANSETTFPLDNSGVATTNKLILSLNDGVLDTVKSAKATLSLDNNYQLGDTFTIFEKAGLDLESVFMLNSTNTLTLKAGVSSTIPQNALTIKDKASAKLENTGLMDGLTLTGTLGYEHEANTFTDNGYNNTVKPSLELKAEYKGNVNVEASVKEELDMTVGVAKSASTVTRTLTMNSKTNAKVKVSKDFMPSEGLMVTPSAKLETNVLVNSINENSVAVSTTGDTTNLKFTPAVDLSYQALENLKLTAGLSSEFMFDNTDQFAFRTATPKVSVGLSYNW